LLLNQSLTLNLANFNLKLIEVNQMLIIVFVKKLSALPNVSPPLIGVEIEQLMEDHGNYVYSWWETIFSSGLHNGTESMLANGA